MKLSEKREGALVLNRKEEKRKRKKERGAA